MLDSIVMLTFLNNQWMSPMQRSGTRYDSRCHISTDSLPTSSAKPAAFSLREAGAWFFIRWSQRMISKRCLFSYAVPER